MSFCTSRSFIVKKYCDETVGVPCGLAHFQRTMTAKRSSLEVAPITAPETARDDETFAANNQKYVTLYYAVIAEKRTALSCDREL